MPGPLQPSDCVIGKRVRVIGAPERQGEIAESPRAIDGGWTVRVAFDDGTRRALPLEHLEDIPAHIDALRELASGRLQGPDNLRRNLLHEKLNGRLSDVVYSMDASDTNFLPYQFKPILKLLESPNNSLLIADEVGLGKTIEAGLIWTELRAREGARTLLVVCPPHLVSKWRKELKRRFGVEAQSAGPTELIEKLEECRRHQTEGFALVGTYHGLRPPKDWDLNNNQAAARLARLLSELGDREQPILDLLVMDEAAIMRNEDSQTSKLGGLLTPIAKHKVYLSATPLHTRARNLLTLLRRLDPDTFPNEQTFAAILEANAPLVALRNEVLSGRPDREGLLMKVNRALDNPLLHGNRSLNELRQRILSVEDLADARVRADLAYQSERANLLAYVVTRTRRREVESHQVYREVNTITVPLTLMEQALYHQVTEAVHAYADQNDISAGFLTVMPQRQVASSVAAAYQRLSRPEEEEADLNPDMTWEKRGSSAGPLVNFLRGRIGGGFSEAALRANDSKYAKLLEGIKHHWSAHPDSKIVLFAYFKPTLYYLSERLRAEGISSLLLTGDEVRDKQEVVDEFEKSPLFRILLSSEVGSEGLDLQFASALVNYDLPWNPMVVEQRIGRIHRIGQKADRIVVMNLVCQGTVDERIYDRLYDRLDLFRKTIGDLEAVIGPLINELTKDLFSLRLSPAQQLQRIEDTAVAVENQLKQEEQLEQNASVLAAYGDYVINQIAAAHNRGDWIHGQDLQAYVLNFFRRESPATRIRGLDQELNLFEIELDAAIVFHFDNFLSTYRLRGQTRLAGGGVVRVQFDHRVYVKAKAGVELVHQAHPLIRFISHYLRTNRRVQPVASAVEITESMRPSQVEPGSYVFVTQRWNVDGVRAYEKLYHAVLCLESQQVIEDGNIAATIVETAAAMGQESEIPPSTDPVFAMMAERAGELDYEGETAFYRFLKQCECENEDRKEIQLRGINSFEARRASALREVKMRHQAAGRDALVAATEGQLRALRDKSEAQRQRLNLRRTTGDCSTIASGVIFIH